jgi:hypothetical protein
VVSSHELSQAERPDCLKLHLQEGRLEAGPRSLQLVGQDWSDAPDYAGVAS